MFDDRVKERQEVAVSQQLSPRSSLPMLSRLQSKSRKRSLLPAPKARVIYVSYMTPQRSSDLQIGVRELGVMIEQPKRRMQTSRRDRVDKGAQERIDKNQEDMETLFYAIMAEEHPVMRPDGPWARLDSSETEAPDVPHGLIFY